MKRAKLTEQQWREVFSIRCRGKRGELPSKAEYALLKRALKEDPERCSKMTRAVFEATKPYGAT